MRLFFVPVISLFFSFSMGQNALSLEQAIEMALSENYNVDIVELDQRMADQAVYRSNAGFGPVIDWNGNIGGTVNNVNQNFLDGRQVNRFGRSFSPNTNINLGMTLYDGGRMQATLKRLQKISESVSVESQLTLQDLVTDVMTTYYNVELQKARVEYLDTIIGYYEDRLQITEERWHVGRGSKIDFLQSSTDLNAQLSERSVAQNLLRNAKVALNNLLNRDLNTAFEVTESGLLNNAYDLNQLIENAQSENRELIMLDRLREISELQVEEITSTEKPTISLRSTLGYSYSNTNAGFLLSNSNASFNTGVSAIWNIFDGHHRKNQTTIARLNTERIDRQHDLLEQQILTDLTQAYNQFTADQELLAFEIANEELAQENLTISIEKFRLGDSSILEVNEAQRTYNIALNRLVNAEFNVKISELELLRLSGALVR